MTAVTFAALLAPVVAAYGILRRPWIAEAPPLSRAIAAAFAPALGLGFASCLSFFLLLTGLRRPLILGLDTAVWLAILAALATDAWQRRGRSRPTDASSVASLSLDRITLGVVALGAVIVGALAARAFWAHASLHPHGEWDAWAIWNLRARAILRGAPDWTAIFANSLAWSNVDYPLLVPLTTARLWMFEGAEVTTIPRLLALVFFASTVASVTVLVGQTRGWTAGLLAGAVLITPHTYVFQASCQCADVPLAQYALIAIACGAMAWTAREPRPWLVAAGAAAGLAAWTKNEGQLLFALVAVATAATIWPRGHRYRAWGAFAVGALVPLSALILFKWRLAPQNYLFVDPSATTVIDRLRDVERWTLIRTHLSELMPAWGEAPGGAFLLLAVVVALSVGRVHRSLLQRCAYGLGLFALMMAGYVVVYAITPLPLEWQILTSFPRLVTQLWPALVWTLFQVAATASPAAVTPGVPATVGSSPTSPATGVTTGGRLLNRRRHLAMLAVGGIIMLFTLLTRTWGIHVDEILYGTYAINAPLGDALIVGNHFLVYLFNYGIYHGLAWLVPSLAPLILPVVYASAVLLAAWWLATSTADDDRRRVRWSFALLLLSPFVLFNATQLMLETLVIALLGATLATALARSEGGDSGRGAALTGLLAALCVLTKATALPALAVLTLALWPLLGRRVWTLLAGAIVGVAVNRAGLLWLSAPSADYGGVGQLLAALSDRPLERLVSFAGIWAFFAGVPAIGALWAWREWRDRQSTALLILAWLSAPAAIAVQMSTNPTLPFPRYAYPVIWLGVAAGALACARGRARWLAPLVLAIQVPLCTALWPGVFNTMRLWPSTVVLEAFQNGGTILSGTPVHGWIAISGQQRERLCVLLPSDSPGTAQAEPWFTAVAQQVEFFDVTQLAAFQQCSGAKAVFDRRFDVNACEQDPCPASRYRIRSCLPQHIAFYAPRFGDVQTRVCLP